MAGNAEAAPEPELGFSWRADSVTGALLTGTEHRLYTTYHSFNQNLVGAYVSAGDTMSSCYNKGERSRRPAKSHSATRRTQPPGGGGARVVCEYGREHTTPPRCQGT